MEVNNTDVFQTLCHANFNDVNIYLPTDNAQLHECINFDAYSLNYTTS